MGERDYETVLRELRAEQMKLTDTQTLLRIAERIAAEQRGRVDALKHEAERVLHAELQNQAERRSDFGGPRS